MSKTVPSSPPAIGFLLQRAHNALRTSLMAELAGTNLHLGHIAILASALNTPGLSQRALSLATGIEKSSVVLFVDMLEREGWLRRELHPSDRRTHALYVTEAGLAQLAQIGPKLRDTEERFLSALSQAERQALADSLTKLIVSKEGEEPLR